MQKLETGDPFPRLQAESVDGVTVTLPDDLRGSPAVVLFYRGHW